MRLKRNQLREAIVVALLAGTTMTAGSALAQEEGQQSQQRATELDAITVTGTRIQSQTVTASAPVAEISAEEFKYSGTTRVEDLLNQFPQMSPGFDAFTVNPTTGYPTADLRGLGSNRTLVLVNGHRLPPGGIRSEARDLNQIPAALVKRVDVLTGGASAVYGSDAMAGVVNFVLDTDFEGISANFGYSGYMHKNDNAYIQGLMDQAGFDYPSGNTSLDGVAKTFDLAVGSRFADGRGHAMAWITYRENDELRQGARDYSSCALNDSGTACGGSGTSVEPNFLITRGWARPDGTPLPALRPDGSVILDENGDPVQLFQNLANNIGPGNTWGVGSPAPYNYAPINHYQRPEERYTFGASVKFELNEHFRPYIDTMFMNSNTSVQIAESGTFFVNALELSCDDPLMGTYCNDMGVMQIRYGASVDANGNPIPVNERPLVDVIIDPNAPLTVYVGKRNVEGGPRISEIESSNFRFVAGAEGAINDFWSYNASVLYGRNQSTELNVNDFLIDRMEAALLGCPPGSYAGCVPYNVFEYQGVTAEQAQALSGIGVRTGTTSLYVVNGYVTGAFDWGLPWANGESVALVAGAEYRKEEYQVRVDSNMETGNFAGLGGPRPSIDGQIGVKELFLESQVPLFSDGTGANNVYLDLGYRWSDYDTSGSVNTYKAGFAATFAENYRLRGGFNRAIRAANTGELFATQQIALFNGDDPCAGASPDWTFDQCARTGVTAAQYGSISSSPASQYNQFIGGNPDLQPEKGDTWTLGFVATPIDNLSLAVDYYDIKIEDRIGTIGASTILQFCALTGDPFLCDKVRRNPVTGDLWLGSSLETSGYIENLTANFGELHFSGIDLNVNYGWNAWGGRFNASFVGSHVLKSEIAPLPGVNDDATYDCAGVINLSCQTPDWRHMVNLRYSGTNYSVGMRWRHVGEMDYVDNNGNPLATDQLLVNNGNKLSSVNYFDISGSFFLTDNIEITAGMNNVADKEPPMVGATLVLNANSVGGYDQLGRYVFANLNVRF